MNEPDAYLPGESPYLEYVYNNESEAEPIYWPVYFTQLTYPKDGSILFNDNPEQYFTYSGGWNNLFVSKQKDGRYKNLSIRAYSGDSFYFYFGAGSFSTGDSTYYAGPLTTSGVYSVLTAYSGEGDAIANKILFTAPADNITVYTLPEISVINFINLYHHEAVSGESYRLYQFLPRTLIQVDDLEADVIDAVTVRVSDSIVVTADSFEDNSILGRKIREGTVSGTLITPGTITTNLIAVSGIDADRINVTTLSALATNTGSLNVTGAITVSGTSSEIDAGFTRITQSGITVGRLNEELPVGSILKFTGRPNSLLVSSPVAGFYIPNDGTSPPTERLIASLGISQYNTGLTDFLIQQNDSAGVVVNMPTVDTTDIQRTSFTVRIGGRAYGSANAAEPQLSVNRDEVRLYSTPLKVLSAQSSGVWPQVTSVDRVALAVGGITVKNSSNATTFSVNSNNGDTLVDRDLTINRDAFVSRNLRVSFGGLAEIGANVPGIGIVPANYLNYNYNGKTKDTAQTVNAGADAVISFQVTTTNPGLSDDTQPWIDTTYAGYYVLTAGVVSSNVTGQTWQATLNSNTFGTGVIMNGITQTDNRAYTTKLLYLAAGARVRLLVRNSSATNMTVTIGGNGTILSAVKVG